MAEPGSVCPHCDDLHAPDFECCGHLPGSIKEVRCPRCGKHFELRWHDYEYNRATGRYVDVPRTIEIGQSYSAGVYLVRIECPHCDYAEDI